MTWSFRADTPIYTQLARALTLRIVAGVYQVGEKLPSVRDLAAEAGVNPNTMQKAMTELEREGLVHSQRTSGRFVTVDTAVIEKAKDGLAEEQLTQFLSTMKDLGCSLSQIIKLLTQREAQGELCAEEKKEEV